MLAVGAVASTGPPPAPQARRASHRLLARPQALPVAIQWPVVRYHGADNTRGNTYDVTRLHMCSTLVFSGASALPWTARTAGGWEDSPTQTGSGAMAAGRGESPEPDVLALILSPSSSDEEPD